MLVAYLMVFGLVPSFIYTTPLYFCWVVFYSRLFYCTRVALCCAVLSRVVTRVVF